LSGRVGVENVGVTLVVTQNEGVHKGRLYRKPSYLLPPGRRNKKKQRTKPVNFSGTIFYKREERRQIMERTLLMIKPDGVERRLVGEIVARMERKGLKLVALEMQHLTKERAENLYAVHKEKHFFGELIEFITRGPIVAMVVEGKDPVTLVRKVMGATNPANAEPGSIRGDYAFDFTENIVHGSDSPENAAREISILFPNL
jgi:nucleoside-diphosphate kinase